MTKGQKLYNTLVASLTMYYPHLYDMTVIDARQNAYNNDNYVLKAILDSMLLVYPEYKDKTFRYLEGRAGEMEYREYKKKNETT